jgi:cyclic pyranopterin phosphate synthase
MKEAAGAHMVDVSLKPVVRRLAEARGRILLRPTTIKAIRERRIEKGDALEIARVAAVLAAKETPRILPLTHPIPLEAVDVSFRFAKGSIEATCIVQAHWKTGVEMEALVATSVALLTLWDLVKSREKTPTGQYPHAKITDLHVVRKEKA